MQKSRKKKIYVAVLAVVVAAFLFDRFLLGPVDARPEYAVAAPDRGEAPQRPAAGKSPAAPAPAGAAPKGSSSLANRLAELADEEDIDLARVLDAFRPSPAWVPQSRSDESLTAQRAKEAAAAFVKKHNLMAVMTGKGGGKAIIDGMCFQVGQQLDKFRLTSIGKRSVVFVWKDVRVELELSRGGGD